MPFYRGVAQEDLIKSIDDALALIEAQPIGPECKKDIDRLRTPDPATNRSPLAAIAAAADDVSLAEAVGAARGVFLFLNPVISYHGLNDTGGKGLDVYTRLNAWDAMGGARMLAYTPLDGEMDSFLAAEYAKKLARKLPVITGLKAIFKCAALMGREGFSGARKLNRLVRRARGGADDSALKEAFLKLDIRDRHQVVDAGGVATGLHPGMKNNLPKDEVMSRYGIPLEIKSFDWEAPEVKPVGEKVFKALEPFYATDEVGMSGLGAITDDYARRGPTGIMFECTLRAARAVAAAVPEMKVIDHKGNPVAPAEPSAFENGLSAPITVGKPVQIDPKKTP